MRFLSYFQKNLLYVLVFSFFLVSSSALNFSVKQKYPKVLGVQVGNLTPFPVLRKKASFPIISAQSVFAVDLTSRVTLYEKDPDRKMLPASTAKLITALTALEYYPLDQVLEVLNPHIEGQKMGLVIGEKITVENLLYGLLMFSANDAAEVLAQNFPGGRDMFISGMNLKANQLNLENSHFENPAGLDGSGQYTTARDLNRVAEQAMNNNFVAQVVAEREKIVESVDGKFVHKLTNINELVGEVEGVVGIKTGWTENARENLVTYIKRDGKVIIISILGSQDRFGETEKLIDWIFSNYEWVEIEENVRDYFSLDS